MLEAHVTLTLTINLNPGTTEEQVAMLEAKAKEERIELLRRQSVRRLLSRDLADGWSAWAEMWSAKRWSKDKLRECANRLHAPEASKAFIFWYGDWRETLRSHQVSQLPGCVHDLSLNIPPAFRMQSGRTRGAIPKYDR